MRRPLEQPPAGLDLVLLEQRVADGWPRAARNVKHIPPPMTRRVDDLSSAPITPSLSLTFAPPRTATNGRFGLLRSPRSTSTSLASSRPAALRQRGGRADDRGVGPVRGTEGVVDVGVLALDEPGDERRVVRRLARIETEVLEQLDAGRQLGQPGPHRGRSSTLGRARPSGGRGGCRR